MRLRMRSFALLRMTLGRYLRMSLLSCLLTLYVALHAQTRQMTFPDTSLADVLTAIDEQYPETKIHFVYNQLEKIRVNLDFSASSAEEAVRAAVGHRPIRVTTYGNRLFVEYEQPTLTDVDELDPSPLVIKLRPLPNVDYNYQYAAVQLHPHQTTLRVAGTQLAHVGTAFDLLSYLPGFSIDDPSALIYLDDMPISMLSDLMTWDSDGISSIDYSVNDDRVAYSGKSRVVHIRTLRPSALGWQGQIHSRVAMGYGKNFRQSASADVHRQKWDLVTRLDYDRQGFYQDLRLNEKSIIERYPAHTLRMSAGMNIRLTPAHEVGFRYQYSDLLNTIEQQAEEARMGHFNTGNLTGLGTDRSTWLLNYAPHHDLNVYYRGHTDHWQLRMGGNYYHDGFSLMDDYRFVVRPVVQRNEIKNTLWAVKAEADRKLRRGVLSLGAEYSHTLREDYYLQSDANLQDFTQQAYRQRRQDRISTRLSYLVQQNRVTTEVGVRFENIDAQIRPDKHFFLFASLGYTGQRWQMVGSYAMHSAMPTYGQTNGFAHYNLEMLAVSGNPDLRPSILHQWTLQAQYGHFNFIGNVQTVKDYIAQRIGAYSAGYFLNYDNVPKATMADATLNYSTTIGPWQTQASASIFAQNLKISYTDGTRMFNDPLLRLSWHNQVQLPWGWYGLAELQLHSSGHRGSVWQQHWEQLDLGILKTYKRWNFRLKVEDVFKSNQSATLSYGNNVVYSRRCYADSRRLSLTVKYKFGAQKQNRSYQGVDAGSAERERMQ